MTDKAADGEARARQVFLTMKSAGETFRVTVKEIMRSLLLPDFNLARHAPACVTCQALERRGKERGNGDS